MHALRLAERWLDGVPGRLEVEPDTLLGHADAGTFLAVAEPEIVPLDDGNNQVDVIYRTSAGDKVKVELTPYDLSKGRITYRTK